jgi:hypothetical protein
MVEMKTEISIRPVDIIVLKKFDELERKRGKAPSPQEIADALEYSDRSGVQRSIERLQGSGLLHPPVRFITRSGRAILDGGR